MVDIAVVSDSHLSPRTPEADTNWDAVVAHLDRHRPDLVVHTGDISLDGANDPGDLRHARDRLDRLTVPWLAVPGNHDIGDIGGTAHAIDDRRRSAYEEVFGDRFWVRNLGRWRLVGFDSQDLLSGGPEGQAVIDRLAAQLSGPDPVVLFHHRPLRPLADDEVDSDNRYVTEPMRSALDRLVDRGQVAMMVTGHVHQWRDEGPAGVRHLWAPTTWATMAGWQPVIGTKQVGLALIHLGDDGSIETELVTPEGMAPHVMGETIPSPYAAH